MKRLAIVATITTLALLGCNHQPTTVKDKVSKKSSKTTPKIAPKIIPKPESTADKGFCRYLAGGRTPHAAVLFSKGCWGPEKTQMITYYLAVHFKKKDGVIAAEETAVMMKKWEQKMGPGWDLGKHVYNKCVKRGKRLMCTYVYPLKNTKTLFKDI